MGLAELLPPARLMELRFDPAYHGLAKWLRHFDVDFYRTHGHCDGIADLRDLTNEQLLSHFITRGCLEGRSFNRYLHSCLDPGFYRAQYPELPLRSDAEAVKHWMYSGFFEKRIPNKTTRDVLDSEFHLFQFGKVGSTAIYQALHDAGHAGLILHIHWASDLLRQHPGCLLSYDEVVNSPADKPRKIIAGVRDPFERLISAYFQSMFDSGRPAELPPSADTIMESIAEDSYLRREEEVVLGWFGHRFFRNIDIYAHEFDRQSGHAVIEADAVKIFLYTFERLPVLNAPLTRFTGLPITLRPTNSSSEKPYAGLYRTVVGSMRFEHERVDRMLSSRLVRHFYSDQDIERMRKRWTA